MWRYHVFICYIIGVYVNNNIIIIIIIIVIISYVIIITDIIIPLTFYMQGLRLI